MIFYHLAFGSGSVDVQADCYIEIFVVHDVENGTLGGGGTPESRPMSRKRS